MSRYLEEARARGVGLVEVLAILAVALPIHVTPGRDGTLFICVQGSSQETSPAILDFGHMSLRSMTCDSLRV